MGNVCNVGLMAQKAEEYGSHDKTFEIPSDGTVRVKDADGNVLMEHAVEQGDIWRMCQTRDLPIRDWVKLGVNRARQTGVCSHFLARRKPGARSQPDRARQHYLKDHDTDGLDIRILSPIDAMNETLQTRQSWRRHDLGYRQRIA